MDYINMTADQLASAFVDCQLKQSEIATAVKRIYKTRDAAKLALIPSFAKKHGLTKAVAQNDAGDVIGWVNQKTSPKVKKAANQLAYLLSLSFTSKATEKGNSRFDAEAYATRFVAAHTKAQVLRLIDALKASIK